MNYRKLSKKYKISSLKERTDIIRDLYQKKPVKEIYATSRDFNLRELEVDFIIKNIKPRRNNTRIKILDIGCGNGYTDIQIASLLDVDIMGIDFSHNMIKGANFLKNKFQNKIKGVVNFETYDICDKNFDKQNFDYIISERCLLNLANRRMQYKIITKIHQLLKKKGIYLMLEGTCDGLERLNKIRLKFGLDPVLDKPDDNFSSLKFREKPLGEFLSKYFYIRKKNYFGMYYFISRVIHPLLAYPYQPRFNAKINKIARQLAEVEPDFKRMGHIMGLVLEAK